MFVGTIPAADMAPVPHRDVLQVVLLRQSIAAFKASLPICARCRERPQRVCIVVFFLCL